MEYYFPITEQFVLVWLWYKPMHLFGFEQNTCLYPSWSWYHLNLMKPSNQLVSSRGSITAFIATNRSIQDVWTFFSCFQLNVKFGDTLKVDEHSHLLTFVQCPKYKRQQPYCNSCSRLIVEDDLTYECAPCNYRIHHECWCSNREKFCEYATLSHIMGVHVCKRENGCERERAFKKYTRLLKFVNEYWEREPRGLGD